VNIGNRVLIYPRIRRFLLLVIMANKRIRKPWILIRRGRGLALLLFLLLLLLLLKNSRRLPKRGAIEWSEELVSSASEGR
jgi:hypothetical protein